MSKKAEKEEKVEQTEVTEQKETSKVTEMPEVIRITTAAKDNDGEFTSFFFLTTHNKKQVYELKYVQAPKKDNVEKAKERYIILAANAVEQLEKSELFNAKVELMSATAFVEKYAVDLI